MPDTAATAAPTQELLPLGALAQTFAQRVEAALPVMYARWLSLHDASGYAHWQSGSELGSDERDGLRAALESFAGHANATRLNYPLRSDRTAVLLRACDLLGEFTGFVMLVVENRRLRGNGVSARDMPLPVLRAVRDWGATLGRLANAVHVPTDACRPSATNASANDSSGDAAPEAAELQTAPFSLYAQRLLALQPEAYLRRYEVLVRFEVGNTGSPAPEALWQLPERRHRGPVLDRRVVTELVKWLRDRAAVWRTEPAQFSMPLSIASLCDPCFPEWLALLTREARLPVGLIAFEIDEELYRREPRRIESLATLLHQAGFGLVIDNFSLHDDSVSELLLPGLRLVKIDRSMTGEAAHDKAGQARIAGLAHMARVAGVHSVAKKIGNEREHPLLSTLGIDYVQGFAAAVPAPLDAIDGEYRQLRLIDMDEPQARSA